MQHNMEKAAFRFLGYKFTKIAMDFSDVAMDEELSVSISTSGVYMANSGKYDLNFVFIASNPNNGNDVIKMAHPTNPVGRYADANPKTCCQTIHNFPKSSTFAP